MKSTSMLPEAASIPRRWLALGLFLFHAFTFAPIYASESAAAHKHVPQISYAPDSLNSRTLIFMNNPEFLWASNDVCDLADDVHPFGRGPCRTSLFHINALGQGQYRAWWEHRNMMPFAIRSSLLLSNPTNEAAVIEIVGLAMETNSTRRGGKEFAEMFNTKRASQRLSIKPGERVMLDELAKKWIHPSHFFAGVVDFNVLEGAISLDELVYRKQPSETLTALGYSQRKLWGVHESLVYKGVTTTSAVVLQGAEFHIDDSSLRGSLPVSYRLSEAHEADSPSGTCNPDFSPTCSGSALTKASTPTQHTSWVSHIAPDPRDTNPKRKLAIVDDLVELVVPASTAHCPSLWPISQQLAKRSCMRMSPHFHWFLEDFNHWRLPNWGNWAVQYRHPIRVKNSGERARTVVLKVTADGASPLAYRGTGVSSIWQQVFLNPRSKKEQSSIAVAQVTVLPGTSVDFEGELILSGPGAGTLQHQLDIID